MKATSKHTSIPGAGNSIRADAAGARVSRPGPRLSVAVPGDAAAVRVAEPVSLGLPFPAGACRDEGSIGLSGSAGVVPVQAGVLERWPDGSIRWALLDFQANAPAHYDVTLAAAERPDLEAFAVRERDGTAEVESAGLTFRVPHQGEFQLEVRRADDAGSLRRVRIDVTLRNDVIAHPIVSALSWETRGDLRSVLRVNAAMATQSGAALQFVVRLHFYARVPTVRVELTVANPARAQHPEGFWELGDAGSILFRDCAVRIETGPCAGVRCSVDGERGLEPVAQPFELYQDSSGGENWKSPVHVNRDGVIPVTFQGYRLTAAGDVRTGLRATPVLVTEDGATGVAVRHFWQNAPKALEADGDGLVLRLFPRQFADLHETQGGEQKTHVFHVAFGDDQVSAAPLDWVRRPALVSAPPAWYCSAGAVPYLTPASKDPNTEYLDLVHSVIDGPDSFAARRELIDEYGWRNFGDIYADHETVFHKGPQPLVSHYNNQYDGIAGFAYHFLRTADPRWWAAMEELAWHVRDIDIYHTGGDKSAYNGGLFWHTFHYVDAGRSSHRCYGRVPGVSGGGPANEHAYSTGLMLHFLLTGETASRDAAVGLADWVLGLDDGSRTPLRWVSRGDTGLASKTHTMDYHGPGRGAGNVIVVLLNGYRLTGKGVYLQKAEDLIRRCIHPDDDVAARGLLDAESRWSYTVFLQALGRYLDEKILRGEIDDCYAYAQASLLSYARWMAAHEYLYLEKPRILEYPTETWAAQDMRKSDVFKFAARHAGGTERTAFLERADYFFRESLRMLAERPTRFTARPRVLLMICGFMQAAFQTGADGGRAPEAPTVAFERSAPFLPQKATVKRRLKWLVSAGLLGAGLMAGLAIVL
jgi:hypothetical protein